MTLVLWPVRREGACWHHLGHLTCSLGFAIDEMRVRLQGDEPQRAGHEAVRLYVFAFGGATGGRLALDGARLDVYVQMDDASQVLQNALREPGGSGPDTVAWRAVPIFHQDLRGALEQDLSKPQYADHVALFMAWCALPCELERLRTNSDRIALLHSAGALASRRMGQSSRRLQCADDIEERQHHGHGQDAHGPSH